MGGFKIYKASGRAKCFKCRELIKKDSCQFQVFFKDDYKFWNREKNYHAGCILKEMQPFADKTITDWQSQFNI